MAKDLTDIAKGIGYTEDQMKDIIDRATVMNPESTRVGRLAEANSIKLLKANVDSALELEKLGKELGMSEKELVAEIKELRETFEDVSKSIASSDIIKRANRNIAANQIDDAYARSSMNLFQKALQSLEVRAVMSDEDKKEFEALKDVIQDKNASDDEKRLAKAQITEIRKKKEEEFESKDANKKLIDGIKKISAPKMSTVAAVGGIGALAGIIAGFIDPQILVKLFVDTLSFFNNLAKGEFAAAFGDITDNAILTTAAIAGTILVLGELVAAFAVVKGAIQGTMALMRLMKGPGGVPTAGRPATGTPATGTPTFNARAGRYQAPAGGMTYNGQAYKGGNFLPNSYTPPASPRISAGTIGGGVIAAGVEAVNQGVKLANDDYITGSDIGESAGRVGGAGAGFVAGAQAGLTIGAFTGPAAPVAAPVLGFILGTVGAIYGADLFGAAGKAIGGALNSEESDRIEEIEQEAAAIQQQVLSGNLSTADAESAAIRAEQLLAEKQAIIEGAKVREEQTNSAITANPMGLRTDSTGGAGYNGVDVRNLSSRGSSTPSSAMTTSQQQVASLTSVSNSSSSQISNHNDNSTTIINTVPDYTSFLQSQMMPPAGG